MSLQYIGARYVPKFYQGSNGTEWNTNTAYEALTIVTYLNNSYTSIKPVPASIGNPKDNSDFWAATGNFNAQLQQLQNDVNEIKINLNRRYIVLCDSYGLALNQSNINFYEESFYVLGITNYQGFNSSGCGFIGDGTNTFLKLLSDNLQKIPEKNTVTDIIVFGGANDQGSVLTVPQAIGIFTKFAKSYFPNATVYVGCISKNLNPAAIANLNNTILAYKTAPIYNTNYINNTEFIMSRYTDFNSDLVHPTYNGITKMSKYFCEWLLKGDLSVTETCGPSMEFTDDVDVTYNFSVQYQQNGTVSLKGQNGMLALVTFKAPKSIHVGQNVFPAFTTFKDGFIIPLITGDFSLYSTYYENSHLFSVQISPTVITSPMQLTCNMAIYSDADTSIQSLIINPSTTITIF